MLDGQYYPPALSSTTVVRSQDWLASSFRQPQHKVEHYGFRFNPGRTRLKFHFCHPHRQKEKGQGGSFHFAIFNYIH